MKRLGRLRAAATALWALCGLLAGWVGPGTGAGDAWGESSAWKESAPGIFFSLPERTVESQDNSFRGSFRLKAGEGAIYEREGRWAVDNAWRLGLELTASAVNASSKDYVPGKTAFPVAVTILFAQESAGRPFKDVLYDFFTGPWYGLFTGGIRLTYAWGHDAPVGSMFRLVEGETVFILAGPDEAGKKIESERKLVEDFTAAYGRAPKGAVTKVTVQVERPSKEKSPLAADVLLRLGGR